MMQSPDYVKIEKWREALHELETHLRILSLRTEEVQTKSRAIQLLKLLDSLKEVEEKSKFESASPLYSLAYVSRSLINGDQLSIDCESILSKAQVRNKNLDVTGYLVYSSGYFIQYLEGPKENLEYLYGRIVLDTRHEAVRVLFMGPVEQRHFKQWSMAYSIASTQEEAELSKTIEDQIVTKKGRIDPKNILTLIEYLHSFGNRNQKL